MGFRFSYLSLALALSKDQDQGPAHGRDVVGASVDLEVRWICSRIQRKSFKTSKISLLPVVIVAYLMP